MIDAERNDLAAVPALENIRGGRLLYPCQAREIHRAQFIFPSTRAEWSTVFIAPA